jgi:hypothetical protein
MRCAWHIERTLRLLEGDGAIVNLASGLQGDGYVFADLAGRVQQRLVHPVYTVDQRCRGGAPEANAGSQASENVTAPQHEYTS